MINRNYNKFKKLKFISAVSKSDELNDIQNYIYDYLLNWKKYFQYKCDNYLKKLHRVLSLFERNCIKGYDEWINETHYS